MDELLPNLPDDLGALSDEQLAGLLAQNDTLLEKLQKRDSDEVKNLSKRQLVELAQAAVAAHTQLKDEQAVRDFDVDAALTEALAKPEPVEEPEAQADEQPAEPQQPAQPAQEPVREQPAEPAPPQPAQQPQQPAEPAQEPARAEAVAASAKPARGPVPKPSASRQPKESQTRGRLVITAAADIPQYPMGAELDGLKAVGGALVKRSKGIGWLTPEPDQNVKKRMERNESYTGEDIPVATFDWAESYDDDRRLEESDIGGNTDKIEAVVASISRPGALTAAAGGLCAPLTPFYNLPVISTAARPIRDSLPSFQAARGGIQFATPPTLASITTSGAGSAVGIITAANDASATQADYTKTCQVVQCAAFTSASVDALYHCLQFSNLTARTWPELVENATTLMLAAHARVAETSLLDRIKAASTAVTAARVLGASSDIVAALGVAAEGLRSRHRTDPEMPLRVLLPQWVEEMIMIDILRGQFDRFNIAEGTVDAVFGYFGLRPSFYMDGPSTGTAQVFGAQGAGAVTAFPTAIQAALFPEGTFLYLDGGQLELGLVRDSALNAINRYQMFGEEFFGLAKTGVESLWMTITTSDNGQTSLPVALTPPPAY